MNSSPNITAQIIDSLHVVSAVDIFGSDAELLSGEALPTAGEQAWRQAAPAEIFGTESAAVMQSAPDTALDTHLSDSAAFQVSVVILLAAYMVILLRSAAHMRAIVGAIFHSGGADPSIVEESDNPIISRSMGGITLFSTLLSGIVMVRAADLILGADAPAIPDSIRSAAPIAATAAVVAICLWQLLLHRVVAWVCQSTDVKRLGNITYVFFAAGALLLFPLSATMLLGPLDISSIWVILSVMGIGFVCILYLKETFMFFTNKKISILYWFLYLCSVIVLPVSTICLIAADLQ